MAPVVDVGYPFALLSLASVIAALLAYERSRTAGTLPWRAAVAALAGWLHPWQGETLIMVVLGGEAWMWTAREALRSRAVVLMLGASALPLAYYGALGRLDLSWTLANQAGVGRLPLWEVGFALGWLALPAAIAYRRRPTTFASAAVRTWPLAAMVVFLLAERGIGSSPTHALLGITVPLAILAVERIGSLRVPRQRAGAGRAGLASLLVFAITVPVTASQVRRAAHLLRREQRSRVTASDWRAIAYLANDREPGGVLAEYNLGGARPRRHRPPHLHRQPVLVTARSTRPLRAGLEVVHRGHATRPGSRFVLGTEARFVLAGPWLAHPIHHARARVARRKRAEVRVCNRLRDRTNAEPSRPRQ